MELIRDKKKIIDKIYFKSSVAEIADIQRTQAIKSILDIIDLVVEPDVKNSNKRQRIRKAVLDNINDLHRVFVNVINSLTE